MLKRFTSHTLMALAEASLVALLVVGLIAGTAFAGKGGGGKPGGGGGGTIDLQMVDGPDNLPNYREHAGFIVGTTATDRPFVGVRCYQGSNFVLDAYTGYFEDYMDDPWVTLGSPYWNAAAPADCTARLFYYGSRGRQVVLATLAFVTQP